MKGTVKLINARRGMAALATASGYTSFEVLGGNSIEVGDLISGDLESLGGETWYNKTKSEEFDVFVEDIYGSEQTALSVIS